MAVAARALQELARAELAGTGADARQGGVGPDQAQVLVHADDGVGDGLEDRLQARVQAVLLPGQGVHGAGPLDPLGHVPAHGLDLKHPAEVVEDGPVDPLLPAQTHPGLDHPDLGAGHRRLDAERRALGKQPGPVLGGHGRGEDPSEQGRFLPVEVAGEGLVDKGQDAVGAHAADQVELVLDHRAVAGLARAQGLLGLFLFGHVADDGQKHGPSGAADRPGEHGHVADAAVGQAVAEVQGLPAPVPGGPHVGLDVVGREDVYVLDGHGQELFAPVAVKLLGRDVGVEDLAAVRVDEQLDGPVLVEHGPVERFGLAQALFRTAAVGHVQANAGEPDGPSRRIAQDRRGPGYPDRGAVGALVLQLDQDAVLGAPGKPLDQVRQVVAPAPGRNRGRERPADQDMAPVAEEIQGEGVGKGDQAGGVEGQDEAGRLFDDFPMPAVAGRQDRKLGLEGPDGRYVWHLSALAHAPAPG